jgi:hypothetical protein
MGIRNIPTNEVLDTVDAGEEVGIVAYDSVTDRELLPGSASSATVLSGSCSFRRANSCLSAGEHSRDSDTNKAVTAHQ